MSYRIQSLEGQFGRGDTIATVANAEDAVAFFKDFDTKSNGRVKCIDVETEADGCVYAFMSSGIAYIAEPVEG